MGELFCYPDDREVVEMVHSAAANRTDRLKPIGSRSLCGDPQSLLAAIRIRERSAAFLRSSGQTVLSRRATEAWLESLPE